MDHKGKPKSLTVSDEINILVQVDTHIGTLVEQASQFRLSLKVKVSKVIPVQALEALKVARG
jgi:hypothetical protein